MEQARVLDVGQVAQDVLFRLQVPLHGHLQGHQPRRAGLEVHVVGFGGAALGAVVENGIALQVAGEVEGVHEAVPDRLVHVAVAGDDQVVREDGVRIDLDAVEPALAALEAQVSLLRGTVFLAEEAALGREDLVRVAGQRGLDAGGVTLGLDGDAAHLQILDPGSFQRTEMTCGQRPDGELVRQEFFDRDGAAHIGVEVSEVVVPG